MPDQPFRLESFHIVPEAVLIILFHISSSQRVEQVEVEVSGPCSLKAGPKFLLRLFLVLCRVLGCIQLGGQIIRVSRIPFHQGFSRRLLGSFVYKGRVDILSSGCKECVHHVLCLLNIDDILPVFLHSRETHHAEAQLYTIINQMSHMSSFL